MLTDARWLPSGTTLDTDVCIVGAGPAGITLALEWAGAGFDVVLLESGAVVPEKRDQVLARGENADPNYYRLSKSRVIGFGGASNHWMATSGMRARPLDPIDFRARPEVDRWGWPFDREHLDPYYERAQAVCRLGPYDYGLSRWKTPDARPLPLDPALVETAMFQIGPLGNFPDRLTEIVSARNVHLVVHGTALEYIPDETGERIAVVSVSAGDDHRCAVKAKHFVQAGGGLENPRMLLLSRRRHPEGIGNAHGQVGRYLMEHPHARTGVLRLTDPSLAGRLALYDHGETDGTRRFGMLALPDEVLQREGLLASVWSLYPTDEALASPTGRALFGLRETLSFGRPIPHTAQRLRVAATRPGEVARVLGSFVDKRRGGSGQPTLMELRVMSEQAPNPSSRVLLGARKDKFGRPVARVDWRLSDLDHHTIRRSQEVLDDAFRKADLGYVEGFYGDEDPPTIVGGGYHHIGTTLMHPDPKRGVVDAACRVHGIANLHVAGMSVFPTAGYANPTLTVVALAIRLADHLKSQLTA